jgi:hypothetical protein
MTTKTVFYSFTTLKNVADNTLVDFSDITIDLPESGIVFKSVKAILNFTDQTTVAANYTRRELRLGLGGGTKTAIANTATYTNSGENIASVMTYDFTSLFTSQWSGTSMTSQASTQIAQDPLGQSYVSLVLQITYEFDETLSNVRLKSVLIPLNAPTGDLPTAKPGTPTDTFPLLSTYLPESTKSIKNAFITLQGNTNRATSTDADIFMQLNDITSDSWFSEGAQTSDIFYTYIYNITGIIDISTSYSFYLWSQTLARFTHQQVFLTVTYTYEEDTTTTVLNSIALPMEVESLLGYSAARPQTASRDFLIQETGTITTNRIALLLFWEQAVVQTGLNLKIGSGGFVSYGDRATAVSGNNAAMIRNDSAFTLTRGRNTLTFSGYTTVGAASTGTNPVGLWLINYTSDKHSGGTHKHNTTVFDLIGAMGTLTASTARVFTNYAISTSTYPFYLNSIGVNYTYVTNATGLNGGVSVMAERRFDSDGIEQRWETLYIDVVRTDAESGIHNIFSQSKNIFKRWTDDPSLLRIDPSLSRDYLLLVNVTSFDSADMVYTYHNISYTVDGSLSGFGDNVVTIQLRRYNTDEVVLQKTQNGDGTFSFEWFDNTEPLYVYAIVDDNITGKSIQGLAGIDFFDVDISGNFNILIELN